MLKLVHLLTSQRVLRRLLFIVLVAGLALTAAAVQAQDLPSSPSATAQPVAFASPIPAGLAAGLGRVLVAVLSDFRLYAYENGELIHSSIMAHGRTGLATQTGSFSVERKATIADLTFRGNTVQDVPFVIAYDTAFAIHGAYWLTDEQWGTRASSGCINLPLDEAEWFYDFTEIGTPVIIID